MNGIKRLLFLFNLAVITQFEYSIDQTATGNGKSDNIYESIASSYLPSFTVITHQKKEVIPDKTKRYKPNLVIKKLDEYQKRKVVFELFSKVSHNKTNAALGRNIWKDMELFCGSQTHAEHIFSRVNRTKTIFGEAVLASWIGEGLTSQSELLKRQEIVKHLLADKKLSDIINQKLDIVKQSQDIFLAYWLEEDINNEKLLDRLYFGKLFNIFNSSSGTLEASTRLDNLGVVLSLSLMPSSIIFDVALNLYSDGTMPFSKALKEVPSALKKFTSFEKRIFKDPQHPKNSNLSIGDLWYIMDQKGGHLLQAGALCGVGLYVGLFVYQVQQTLSLVKLKKDSIIYLQNRLMGVANVINELQKLNCMLQENEVLKTKIPELAKLSLLFASNTSCQVQQKLAQFSQLINTNTFKEKASFFSFAGRILLAHKLMQEIKDELAPALEVLGIIDSYLSIAKLIREFDGQRATYSFVKFMETNTPSIELKDFWNPMLDTQTVVMNDICLGKDCQNQNIVLTGPNTGGKSTIIKGVILSLILGQSLGIAPASKASFTIFENINTYLNITDDLVTGNSLFKAEVLRAKELITAVRSLRGQNKFSFAIMDEVFSGTSPLEGEQAAYMFTKELAKHSNSMFVVATHFPKLTQLEQELSNIVNYRVTIIKNADGTFKRPYKLERGKNEINIAFDLLNEEHIF